MEKKTITLNVNGKDVIAEVDGNQTLLRYLRDDLGLMGAKNGCSSGHCGACTVLVDGKAKRSCLLRMKKLDGSRILTIEGLAQNGDLHPLQQAFAEKGATQCGFCTPGMILTAKGLLDVNPNPSADEIKAALVANRNTCRCTGYVKIIEAIQLAAGRMLPVAVKKPLPVSEKPVELLTSETVQKVKGETRYGDDIEVPGMLFGKILWSSHPHAEILGVDTSEAEKLPGVHTVITAKDIPGKNQAGILIRDQPAIAEDKVRYIGDGVAAVFADSLEVAEKAVELIRVDYRPLPAVFTPEEAALPDAPLVHAKGNFNHHAEIVRGDVEEAFKNCAVVVENTFTTPMIEHGFLEPESGLGFPDEDGGVTVKVGSQCVFDDRQQLSEILDLPLEKVRVIQLPLGGAFGGKEDLLLHQYLALGALKSGKPVKIVLCRDESLRVHVKRHPAKMHFKLGVDSTGKFQALEANILTDSGAYTSLSTDILENMVVFAAGPYFVPNVKIDGKAYSTNNVICGAMRGFGVNQVAYALESVIDEASRSLKLDPFEIRRINGLDTGLPTASDHVLEPGIASIKETIEAARKAYLAGEPIPEKPGKRIGMGVACAVKNVGYGHGVPEDAGAIIELLSSGKVILKTSQHEYGQGVRAGLAELVRIELGVDPENVQVELPNTAVTPITGPTTASRQTFLTGNAVVAACQKLKGEITARAAEILNVSPELIRIKHDHLVDTQSGKYIPISLLGEKIVIEERYSAPVTAGLLESEASSFGKPGFNSRRTHYCYIYSTQVAVVEVDLKSGEVDVLKVIAAVDVGRALNIPGIEGQIQGGVMMGLGYALSEEFIVEQGFNKTKTLHDIHLPGADKTPDILPVIVEVPLPYGPNGVKGFAEGPSLATAPAILNAIYDAIGVRITSLPANKERVKTAMLSNPSLKN